MNRTIALSFEFDYESADPKRRLSFVLNPFGKSNRPVTAVVPQVNGVSLVQVIDDFEKAKQFDPWVVTGD